MWWAFKNGFARKLGYLIAAALFGMIVGHSKAWADAQICYVWVGKANATFADSDSACASYNQSGDFHGGTRTQAYSSDVPTGAGASQSAGCKLHITETSTDGFCEINATICHPDDVDPALTVSVTVGACPPPTAACSSPPGTYDISPPGNAPAATGSSACGSDNCSYTMGPQSTARRVIAQVPGGQLTMQTATSTGQSCDSGAASGATVPQVGSKVDSGSQVSDCQSSGSTVACAVQNPSGQYCGTYNGDYVCVGQVAAGTCVAYSSGGVACTVNAQKPVANGAPDSGTTGQPAIPDEVVVAPDGTITNYYNAAKVSGSTKGAATSGTGTTGAKNGTGGTGTGAAADSPGPCVPSAETQCGDSVGGGQDCAAPPTCSGDAVTCGIMNQSWLSRCATTDPNGIDQAVQLGAGEVVGSSQIDLSNPASETGYVTGGGGECPSPFDFTFFGRTVHVDLFVWLCQFAVKMAPFVLVLAYLAGARIWMGAVLQT